MNLFILFDLLPKLLPANRNAAPQETPRTTRAEIIQLFAEDMGRMPALRP